MHNTTAITTAAGIRLEDIHSLCDEVRLLVKAGLPLEQHLVAAGRGHSPRLQQVTQSIVDGLNSGRSLEQLIGQDPHASSRMLSAAVAAGVRSGQLADAIELLGDLAGDLVQLRRQILQAAAYPLSVLIVAWSLFALVVQHTLSRIFAATQQLDIPLHPVLTRCLQFQEAHAAWLWLIPLLLLLLAGFWLLSGRAASMAFRGPERLLLLLPGVGTLLRDLQFYTVSRMLSLLTDRQLPLPDALILAGSSCGSLPLETACRQLAEQVRNGQPDHSQEVRWRRSQLPPLLQACLLQPLTEAGRFSLRLKAVTDFYRERLQFNTTWIRTVLPVALFLVIGGGAVLIYVTAVFWPVVEIYRRLAELT